jgi:hypothetical protein
MVVAGYGCSTPESFIYITPLGRSVSAQEGGSRAESALVLDGNGNTLADASGS